MARQSVRWNTKIVEFHSTISETDRNEIRNLIGRMRSIAAPTMHSYWDVIFEGEALLKELPMLPATNAKSWIAYSQECLLRDQKEK